MIYNKYGGRGQVVKALDCDSSIRGFKSRRSPILVLLIFQNVKRLGLKYIFKLKLAF